MDSNFNYSKAVSSKDYKIYLSEAKSDPEWDTFVAHHPNGSHGQTTLWGQVKAASGCSATRLIVTDRDGIVAGGQFLVRALLPGIRVGYVTKGPLCPADNLALTEMVLRELLSASKSQRVNFLVIQPPQNGELIIEQLTQMGFVPGWVELAPTATVLIELTQEEDHILARMKRQTRQNIRRGEDRGVQVREGQWSDLPVFYRLHAATNERYGTRPYSEEYFENMWNILEPNDLLKLFLAYYENEPVSALLTIPFGNSVIASKLGWSGRYGDARPNEVLFWEVMKWSKRKGYRYFDFEGIDFDGAKAVLEGKPLPESLQETPTRFKLSFGGEVILNPKPCDYMAFQPLHGIYNAIMPRLVASPKAHSFLRSFIQSI